MAKKPELESEDLGPVMGRDPLSAEDEVLATTFFVTDLPRTAEGRPATVVPQGKPAGSPRRAPPRRRAKKSTPTHYKIISISLYNEDIDKIDELVAALKAAGHPKANRSALIRYAIDTVDIEKMPKSY
ncbi:MAG: hypothetical protein H6700_07100 [Myxococcales bacterium]|nr:hypothetical protein [Myxococcales bacterium]MCB9520592.1 hypothetical protein [Myxococcales bacterium]MCB9531515.1 hypothetical protein [Myxococcales bacterium]